MTHVDTCSDFLMTKLAKFSKEENNSWKQLLLEKDATASPSMHCTLMTDADKPGTKTASLGVT